MNLNVRRQSTGDIAPVTKVVCRVKYEVDESEAPFRFFKYIDHTEGKEITQVAVANVSAGDLQGNLMTVYRPGEGGEVVFLPGKVEPADSALDSTADPSSETNGAHTQLEAEQAAPEGPRSSAPEP